MIRRIYADLPRFKNLEFRSGLNVLLAEKSAGATDKHTRNRAGKSSLLDIVHFLLGSNCDKDSLFRSDAISEAVFGMEFDLAGTFARVERTGAKPSPVTVAGDSTLWPISPTAKGNFLSNDNWKTVLGKLMFGLDDFEGPWGPSFRSLLSYFVRRDREGGMEQPMMNSRQQRLADQQVNISFLLGLDWSAPREWQRVRDREKSLEQLKKSMKEGAFGAVIGTASQLKSELIVAQDRAKRLRIAVSSFKVVEQYHELEREASRLTGRLAELADENVLDKRYIAELEAATVEEIPPAPSDLDALFREAGVVLPDLVKRRYDEAAAFHESIVKNRRAYLESELDAARRRIAARDEEKTKLDTRRAELMNVLKSSGALEHFVALQAELTKAETAVESLRQRYDAAESLEAGDLKLRVERATLLERLRRDYIEQGEIVQDAVLTFRDISSQLYEDDKAGTLTITPTENGPIFDPHIPGEKSKGVNNMKIFCFDMMLMLLSLRRGRSPGFLMHDSHLFDGVDERQVGKALAVGAALAATHGFQYLVTMNTDDVPREVPVGFRIEDYALPVTLTDASEDGGLFGFRFE
jgi:uncharacterized protein YydD (DUF2326 family)